jgi:protein-S-isoprenylcysteine O-methyltransferase Ste14
LTAALSHRGAGALARDLVLAGWLLSDAVRGIAMISCAAVPVAEALIALGLRVTAVRLISRPPARQADTGIVAVVIVAASLFWSAAFLLVEPTSNRLGWPETLLQTAAAAIIAAGMVYPGRSFALLPACRTLVAKGPYACVRHPIYAGYLVFDLTVAIQIDHGAAFAIWGSEVALLSWRAMLEERLLLAADPDYRPYATQVRYRLCPGLF